MNSSSDSAPDADSSPPPSSPLLPQPRTPAQTPPLGGLDPEKLLAAALRSSPVTLPAHDWEPPAPALVNGWFAEYEVDRLIGRGAMGAVYHAVQTRLGREVAIKLLPAALAQREEMAARFEREARALARLNHPNIVGLHDFGRTASGFPFIVMEHVAGADLSRLIRSADLSMPQALEIIGQVCDALQYAHGQGFIHRDIKPGNILVDTTGRVRIADFGLTKILGAEPGQSAGRTLTGASLGTPEYTAPEQLRGGVVDHRADIYSLGVMLYEMLTGDLPRGAWAPPSQRAGADARLDEVVTRAMQTEPDKRYQQAGEVKTAISGPPSPALAPPTAPQPLKTRPLPGNIGLALIFFLCAITLSALIPQGYAVLAIQICGPVALVGLWFLSRTRKPAARHGLLAGLTVGATVFGAKHLGEEVAAGKFELPASRAGRTSGKELMTETQLSESKEKTARMLAGIRETVSDQERKVGKLRSNLEKMRAKYALGDPPGAGVDAANPDLSPDGNEARDLRVRLTTLEERRNRLATASGGDAYEMIQDDATITRFAAQWRKDQATLDVMLDSGFGPNHPRITGLKYTVQKEREILDSAVKRYLGFADDVIRDLRRKLQGPAATDGGTRAEGRIQPGPEKLKEYSELKLRHEMALETLQDLNRSATQLTMGALNLFRQEVDSISGYVPPAGGQPRAEQIAGDREQAAQTDPTVQTDRAGPARTPVLEQATADSPPPMKPAEPRFPKEEILSGSAPMTRGGTMPEPAAPAETMPPRPETAPAPPEVSAPPPTPSDLTSAPVPPASEPTR